MIGKPDAPQTHDPHAGWASLAVLLYRYLWPTWLFRDASQGSALERADAYRHNRSVCKYLPGYAGKWTGISAATLLCIRVAEGSLPAAASCNIACAVLGVWFAWTVIVALVFLAAWLWLNAVG